MNPEQILRYLVENGKAWAQTQRDLHRPASRPLTVPEKAAFGPFFDAQILDSARVCRVPVIGNPGFYANLEAMGIPAPLDFTTSQGITFIDTILVSDREHPPAELLEPLLFHELVPVVQYHVLGRDAFVERYVHGWAENGQDYFRIPLERDAYALQARFEALPKQGFSVQTEVHRQLGLA